MVDDCSRFAIEFDVLPQYSAPTPFFQRERDENQRNVVNVDSIRAEQKKTSNNGLGQILQIARPLS